MKRQNGRLFVPIHTGGLRDFDLLVIKLVPNPTLWNAGNPGRRSRRIRRKTDFPTVPMRRVIASRLMVIRVE